MTDSVDSRQRIAGAEVWELAAAEYRRMLALLRTLGDGDWTRPTDCTAWDVRAMLGHVVGAVEGYANPREMNHQYRLGAKLLKRGEPDGRRPVDGANGAVWYRIPDAPYSVPYVPPSVTVGSMGHLGRMGHDG